MTGARERARFVCSVYVYPSPRTVEYNHSYEMAHHKPPLLRGNNEFIQRRSLATESPNAVGAVWNLEAGRGESEECTAKFDALSQQAHRKESEQFQKQKTKAGLQRDLPYKSVFKQQIRSLVREVMPLRHWVCWSIARLWQGPHRERR